jgi:hypothetical protein
LLSVSNKERHAELGGSFRRAIMLHCCTGFKLEILPFDDMEHDELPWRENSLPENKKHYVILMKNC